MQDFIILFCSIRRDGKSLGQMARDESAKSAGSVALVTVLSIMIVLLAVVALVVVNALKGSPWGTFTIASTMPIAVLMGLYLRYVRPGKVLECSVIGFGLVLLAVSLEAVRWRHSVGWHRVHIERVLHSHPRSSSMGFSRVPFRYGCCLLPATI